MTKMNEALSKLETDVDSTQLLEKLIRCAPYRIVLKKTEDGTYLGLCENSFSMSWEKDRVQIYWSGTGYSNLGTTHQLDAVSWAAHNAKEGDLVLDPFSDDCPIEIDWTRWLKATNKYDSRNARFINL